MLPKNHNELSQKQQAALGIPDGMKVYSPFPFGGMNQQDSRIAIEDNEFFVLENFIKIGKGNLRTVWDNGEEIYTAPSGKTIVYYFFFNINLDLTRVAVFLSDGTAVQVNTATGAIIPISSSPGTFYNGGQLPACAQYGSQYLLISNNITPNSYWIWDGTSLYGSGTLGPIVDITNGGTDYSSAPSVVAFGGTGTGASFTAEVANGSVVSIIVDNPGTGYLPGSPVQLAFSGGGSDNSAILQAVLASGTLESIILLNGGSGYNTVTISFTGGGGGTGAAASATVTGGVITEITVTSPGSGYTSTPTVVITDSGSGSGAQALAVLNPGSVDSVNVINGGSGFTATPTLTFVGGGGTGAAATATITTGSISSVTVTNGGSGYTSTPTIEVQSGINNAASATVNLMPFGVSGSAIETFQQRVWLTFPNQQGQKNNGGTILVSAPSEITDFATSDGGLIYVSSTPFLRAQYFNIKQSNGYLYPFGDSSVDVISNVQTNGSPPTTTFNYQNTDPQIGTAWRDSCKEYSRSILFGNPLGIFGLYGGSATKISGKMDNIFTNAVFPPTAGAVTPCSAVANIFTQKIFLFLITIVDPISQNNRNVLLSWDEKEWMVLSQSTNLLFISTQEINSNLIAWGTDGTKLFPLFNTPSSKLDKTLSTKLYGAQSEILVKEADMVVIQAQDNSADKSGISFTTSTVDNENSPIDFEIPISFTSPKPQNAVYSAGTPNVVGVNLGMTLISNSPDFTLNYLGFGYRDVSSVFGSQNLNQTPTGE